MQEPPPTRTVQRFASLMQVSSRRCNHSHFAAPSLSNRSARAHSARPRSRDAGGRGTPSVPRAAPPCRSGTLLEQHRVVSATPSAATTEDGGREPAGPRSASYGRLRGRLRQRCPAPNTRLLVVEEALQRRRVVLAEAAIAPKTRDAARRPNSPAPLPMPLTRSTATTGRLWRSEAEACQGRHATRHDPGPPSLSFEVYSKQTLATESACVPLNRRCLHVQNMSRAHNARGAAHTTHMAGACLPINIKHYLNCARGRRCNLMEPLLGHR